MHAQLTFSFPFDVSAADAIHAVANHFAVGVSIMGQPANVPPHIKAAVEGYAGAGGGVEPNPAIAFGGLLNGAAGNGQATQGNAPSSADVATSTTAHAAQPATSQTTPPASSVPAPPQGNAAVAHAVSAAPTNHAALEFDSTGLPWDERIHSGNKTKSPSGEWRTRKGVDKGEVKRVTEELRAAVGNAGVASVATTVAAGASASIINAPASPNRDLAIQYAHNEAIRVCGDSPIDHNTLTGLLNGRPATLTPAQNDWYVAYFAKRNAAFSEYMAGNVASAAPDASASLPQTGNVPAAPAAIAPVSDASLAAAVGTATPAPTAPQGELDAAGLPHDTRINVDAKIKDAAGVWVQRFDVSPETKVAVMAELRAAQAPNGAAQATSTPVGPASVPAALPVITAEQASADFATLMKWIVQNQIAKRISATAAQDAAQQLGMVDGAGNGQIAQAANHVDYLPYVVQMLQQVGAV